MGPVAACLAPEGTGYALRPHQPERPRLHLSGDERRTPEDADKAWRDHYQDTEPRLEKVVGAQKGRRRRCAVALGAAGRHQGVVVMDNMRPAHSDDRGNRHKPTQCHGPLSPELQAGKADHRSTANCRSLQASRSPSRACRM